MSMLERATPAFSLTVVLLLSVGFPTSKVNAEDGADRTLQLFFKTYCLRCHGGETQKGKFRLDTLAPDFANPQIAEKWSEVVFRINAAEMPPKKERQPSAAEIGNVVDALTTKIREGAAARMARRGLVEHYRLSRQEYAHTVYDLLGVVFDVEAPGAFNEDPRWHGFDRIGALLSTAPSHIERYLDAADAIVERAFPDGTPRSGVNDRSPGKGKRQLLQLGESWHAFDLKRPGHYRIKIHASGLPAFTGRAPRLSLWHNHHKKPFAGVDLVTAEDKPRSIEFDLLLPVGGYQIRNHARSQRHPNGAYRLFRNETIDASTPVASLKGGHKSYQTKIVDEQGRPVMPLLLVDRVEVDGPLATKAELVEGRGVFPANEDDPKELEACLRRFAERAWRRPVSDTEIDPYVKFVVTLRQAGEKFRAAYRSALTSVLVTRSFFNLEEGSADKNRANVNDFELASRLSYFLWSSMPDNTLFAAAREGKLHQPERLAAEFDRMIADPKIERFLDSFPKQWLQLHRVGMFQPDPKLYPEYGPWLEDSMVLETTAYFA